MINDSSFVCFVAWSFGWTVECNALRDQCFHTHTHTHTYTHTHTAKDLQKSGVSIDDSDATFIVDILLEVCDEAVGVWC